MIAIAFLTAIAGGILSVVASLYLTELYHVSNFEGGRGMLIFFALAPLDKANNEAGRIAVRYRVPPEE